MPPRPEFLPVLEGDLIRLRPIVAADFDALLHAASDPLIWEQHPERDRWTEPVFRRYFEGALAADGGLVIVDRATGEVIGSSRYHAYDPRARSVEIGWTFLVRSRWGGRYNAELKRLMLDHAFRHVDRVDFLVGPANHRSQRAVEKIGGVRGEVVVGDAGRESVRFCISRDHWRSENRDPRTGPESRAGDD